MNPFLLIFVGGGLGSLSRYTLGRIVQAGLGVDFPVGTLVVNAVASLVLGAFIGYETRHPSPTGVALVAIGFCGGFSTFSTFSNDTLQLLLTNRYLDAFLNIALNVLVCLGATFLGILSGKFW
jgi:CrcB protein